MLLFIIISIVYNSPYYGLLRALHGLFGKNNRVNVKINVNKLWKQLLYKKHVNVKISVAAIPIGLLIFFIIAEKFFTKKAEDIEITLFIIAWTIITFFITGSANLEIFVVLVILAVLITKEITYDFTPVRLKNKLNVLISILLIFFVLIMTNKIMDILNI